MMFMLQQWSMSADVPVDTDERTFSANEAQSEFRERVNGTFLAITHGLEAF